MNESDLFLMDRLEEFFGTTEDPWSAGFEMAMLEDPSIELVSQPYSESVGQSVRDGVAPNQFWSGEQHAGRILYLMSPEASASLFEPIVIDCSCDRGQVYADPIMIDGWHRYLAHRALQSETIRVSFGGLVDLAEYLNGTTDERPE